MKQLSISPQIVLQFSELLIYLLDLFDEDLVILDYGFDKSLLCCQQGSLELPQQYVAMLYQFLSYFCLVQLFIGLNIPQQLLYSLRKPI